MKEEFKRFIVKLKKDIHKALKKRSAEKGVSMNEIAASFIEQGLKGKK